MKTTKKSNYIIIFTVLTLMLTACSTTSKDRSHKPKNMNEVKVYFTKTKEAKKLFFVPVKRFVSKEDNTVSAALRELFLGPTKKERTKGIMTEIPVGTRLIDVEEADDEVLVDVSSQLLTSGGSATVQLRYLQIYKTLSDMRPNKEFYLNVEGMTLKAIGGEGLEVKQPLAEIPDYTEEHEPTENVQP